VGHQPRHPRHPRHSNNHFMEFQADNCSYRLGVCSFRHRAHRALPNPARHLLSIFCRNFFGWETYLGVYGVSMGLSSRDIPLSNAEMVPCDNCSSTRRESLRYVLEVCIWPCAEDLRYGILCIVLGHHISVEADKIYL
jgi:hypothetical protein